MATTAGAYGLKPVKLLTGAPYNGATRHYPIASGYGTNIFNGSIVEIVAGGGVQLMLDKGTAADPFSIHTIGVFVGCTYTDPNSKQVVFSQYWPSGTVASDAQAYVVDYPNVLFKAQADGALGLADRGFNVHLVNVQATGTGSTTTGNSNVAVEASTANVTATFPFRIVDFTEDALNSAGDAYTEVLVKINPAYHSFTNTGAGI
jgi:hypothetical protein